jgi:hypothetical protein
MSSKRSHRHQRRHPAASLPKEASTRPSNPPELPQPRRFPWVAALTLILAAAAAIIGVPSAWSYLRPQVEISSTSPLDPASPFSTPFTIRNAGNVELRAVNILCNVLQATDANGNVGYNLLTYRPQPLPRLHSGETESTFCRDASGLLAQASSMEVTVEVSYHSWLPWSRRTIRRFTTAQAAGGVLRWLEIASEQ